MNAKTMSGDPAAAARPGVSCVMVEPVRLWVHCPRCQAALSGFVDDPRGLQEIVCQSCGEDFDIPASANIVIV
jgi:hypothetical protein